MTCPSCEYNKERAAHWRREAYRLGGHPLPDEDRAEIYRAQAEEEIKKNRYIKVSERTVRNTIARVKVFAREIPINPTLLKAADEMERMLTELIELRRKK